MDYNIDSIESYTLVREEHRASSIFWYVLWFLLFWPVLILVFLFGGSQWYIVDVLYYNGTVETKELDSMSYEHLRKNKPTTRSV